MASANANSFPQAFGRYILTQKIAMGGMAEIFRAKSVGAEGFEKVVVIKRILPHFSEDEGFVTMFKDEAKMAGHLSHANVVQIFDFDEAEGLFYIAMEYVEGRDLKRVLDHGAKIGKPLSIAQAVHILIEAALGLHYAHTRVVDGEPLKIVHRDVSPHNVMVSFNGEVKIMDFGIAKAASRSTNTRVGTVKGKCAYMSPEQARGKPLDARSDLFALGVCLWEMLTGKRLFVGESDFETLNNVLKAEVPAPSELNPEVPKELDAIVLKSLARDRDNRQADCNAFAAELRRWYYTSVADPEAASLKNYMHDLFDDEIAQLRNDVAAEAVMMDQVRRQGLPMPGSNPGRPSTNSKQRRAVTGSSPAAKGMPEERTIALDQMDSDLLHSSPGDQTRALPDGLNNPAFRSGRSGQTDVAPTVRSRTGWYVGVGAAAAALAAIAVVVATGGNKNQPEPAPVQPAVVVPVAQKIDKITVHIHAPGAQQILVDDNPICTEPTCDYSGEKDKTVKILARAGERMKIVHQRLETEGQTIEVKLPELTTPTAQLAAAAPVVIVHVEPAAAQANVLVNGEVLAIKNGNGKVANAKLGDTLKVEAKAEGYRNETKTFLVQNPQFETFVMTLAKEQEKRAVVAKAPSAGPGKIVVNAKPWAKVALKGKPLGSGLTPVKEELAAGKYTLTLTKGEKTKHVPVTIKPGETTTVNVDMTAE